MTQSENNLSDRSAAGESSPLADLLSLLAGSATPDSSTETSSTPVLETSSAAVSDKAETLADEERWVEPTTLDRETSLRETGAANAIGIEVGPSQAASVSISAEAERPALGEQPENSPETVEPPPVTPGADEERGLLDSLGSLMGGGGDEFDQLQELLVKPEILELRDHMSELRKKVAELEKRDYDPKDFVRLMLPLMSELLNRQFVEFKQQIFVEFKQQIFVEFKQQIFVEFKQQIFAEFKQEIFAEFKQDVLGAIAPILDKVNAPEPESNLSIRVIGLQKDAQSVSVE